MQKVCPYELGPLEHDTELTYHGCLTRRQAEMDAANSREEKAKKLPPECQVLCEERKLQATPVRTDMCLAGMESSLYLNGTWKEDTKPKGMDKARPYRMPKEEAKDKLTLEEELDAKSVFDPLAPSSQSSEAPSSQPRDELSPGSDAAGPNTLPHYCEGPITIAPFDVSVLGIPNKSTALSPVTDHENALLNLAPGSPVKNVGLTGVGHVAEGRGVALALASLCPLAHQQVQV